MIGSPFATTRREFLGGVAGTVVVACAAGSCTVAPTGSDAPDQARPADIPRYLRAMYEWHCRTFVNLARHLSPAEQEYLYTCYALADDWGYRVADNFQYSIASFSHRVVDGLVNSSRLYAGSFAHSDQLRERIARVLHGWGVGASDAPLLSQTAGLGWDLEAADFKAYIHLRDIDALTDPDLRALRETVRDVDLHSEGLASYTIRNGQIREKKVYVGVRERAPALVTGYPFAASIIHTNYMITSKRGIVPQVDLGAPLDPRLLDDRGQMICRLYAKAFGARLDTIAWASQNRYALYFP